MSHTLNSLKGLISGIMWGTTIGDIRGGYSEFRLWLI